MLLIVPGAQVPQTVAEVQLPQLFPQAVQFPLLRKKPLEHVVQLLIPLQAEHPVGHDKQDVPFE